MKKSKRFLPLVIVLIFLFSLLPIETFADPISAIGFAAAMDAYGMSYGVGTTYDVANAQGVTDNFYALWDEFSLYQTSNNADLPTIDGQSYSYDQYIEEWQENYKSVKAEELTHSSGKFAAFYIDEETASVFDQFWNWLLSGPAEMVKVDNAYEWNVDQNTNTIITPTVNKLTTINNLKMSSPPITVAWDYYYNRVKQSSTTHTFSVSSSTDPVYCYCRSYGYSDYPNLVHIVYIYFSTSSFSLSHYSQIANNNPETEIINVNTVTNGWYQYASDFGFNYEVVSGSSNIRTSSLPVRYTVNNNNVSTLLGNYDPNSTAIDESDVSIKPYNGDDIARPVPLPDISDPDYTPTAVTIVSNVPWDDSYDDEDEDPSTGLPVPYPTNSIPDIIDDIADKLVDDGFAIEDDPQPEDPDPPPPAPSEVFYPLLPVAAPSFNFNLSGIWHYVREWVSSLGAWFSLVFTMWSYLPYAIVVPVYATAVIVIVLGVYKRFFM